MKKMVLLTVAGLAAGAACGVLWLLTSLGDAALAQGAPAFSPGGACAAAAAENSYHSPESRPRYKARDALSSHQWRELQALLDDCVDINARDPEGNTLMHTAVHDYNVQELTYLVEHGARTDIKDLSGKTPADYAVYSPQTQAFFVEAAKRPDINSAPMPVDDGICKRLNVSPPNDGRTAQTRPGLTARDAIWYNRPQQLTELIEDCVSPDWKDSGGDSLLHVAAQRDRVELVRILLNHGASLDSRDSSGANPAAYASSPEMKALLGPVHKKPLSAADKRKTDCQAKYQADAALCDDMSCKMRANDHWQRCLKTGQYW